MSLSARGGSSTDLARSATHDRSHQRWWRHGLLSERTLPHYARHHLHKAGMRASSRSASWQNGAQPYGCSSRTTKALPCLPERCFNSMCWAGNGPSLQWRPKSICCASRPSVTVRNGCTSFGSDGTSNGKSSLHAIPYQKMTFVGRCSITHSYTTACVSKLV